MHRPILLCLALALSACPGDDPDADTDGDGLTDGEEAELGTDPSVADTDEDGLNDGAEVNTHDTDPLDSDSDADGYLDGDEVAAGTDPKDATSVIYAGGWPYNGQKEDFGTPTSTVAVVGAELPRLTLLDQFGDQVDLYDFAGTGKTMVVMSAGLNSANSFQVANALKRSASSLSEADKGVLNCIGDGIASGEASWLTTIYINSSGSTASAADLTAWEGIAAVDGVPAMLDENRPIRRWMDPDDNPAFVAIDPVTMTVTVATTTTITDLQPVCDALGG
ncbi:MAG: hypothetical protein AB8H79_13030 [Myxococcota bacterium]